MRHWNETGAFDLSSTKNDGLFERIHLCLGRLLAENVAAGRLSATTDTAAAVAASEAVVVVVPLFVDDESKPDFGWMDAATRDIARGLSTPVAGAERIKTLYGSAIGSASDEREVIKVPLIGEDDEAVAVRTSHPTWIVRRLRDDLGGTIDCAGAPGRHAQGQVGRDGTGAAAHVEQVEPSPQVR